MDDLNYKFKSLSEDIELVTMFKGLNGRTYHTEELAKKANDEFKLEKKRVRVANLFEKLNHYVGYESSYYLCSEIVAKNPQVFIDLLLELKEQP